MPQSAKIPSSLQASIDAVNNTIAIDPASQIKLAPGTSKVGKVESLSPSWGNIVYQDISITFTGGIAANIWKDSDYTLSKNGIFNLILIPEVKIAANVANTNLELAFYWQGDGSSNTTTWVTEQTLQTPSGGYVAVANNIKTWSVPISTLGLQNKYSIILPCLGTMFGFQGRLSNAITNSAKVSFNTYYK